VFGGDAEDEEEEEKEEDEPAAKKRKLSKAPDAPRLRSEHKAVANGLSCRTFADQLLVLCALEQYHAHAQHTATDSI
jgi:hypothetical protein